MLRALLIAAGDEVIQTLFAKWSGSVSQHDENHLALPGKVGSVLQVIWAWTVSKR